MASLEVIVLEELLVLQVAILGLDGVELVSQCEVVFVSLLDLEDLGLELRNEEVLLVTGQMHTIVVLQTQKRRGTSRVTSRSNNR